MLLSLIVLTKSKHAFGSVEVTEEPTGIDTHTIIPTVIQKYSM